MKQYYPKSWSQQAREMCNKQIQYINEGYSTIDDAIRFFQTSYRAPIIRYRAIGRFRRAVKAGKVHEQIPLTKRIYEKIETF